jgi:hypothetical protein
MRAGAVILGLIEATMIAIEEPGKSISVHFPTAGGYRAKIRNLEDPSNATLSRHVDGIAADITIILGGDVVAQCDLQAFIEPIVFDQAWVYHKGKDNAVHVATPTPQHIESDCK